MKIGATVYTVDRIDDLSEQDRILLDAELRSILLEGIEEWLGKQRLRDWAYTVHRANNQTHDNTVVVEVSVISPRMGEIQKP